MKDRSKRPPKASAAGLPWVVFLLPGRWNRTRKAPERVLRSHRFGWFFYAPPLSAAAGGNPLRKQPPKHRASISDGCFGGMQRFCRDHPRQGKTATRTGRGWVPLRLPGCGRREAPPGRTAPCAVGCVKCGIRSRGWCLGRAMNGVPPVIGSGGRRVAPSGRRGASARGPAEAGASAHPR